MAITNQDDEVSALYRAAVISLLTWRRAQPGDPIDDPERYGWWGDSFPSVTDDRIGSRLWLLRRRTLTPQTERDAIDYARESMQWLIDDGRISGVDITAQRGIDRLDLRVILITLDGEQIPVQLDNLWQVIHAA